MHFLSLWNSLTTEGQHNTVFSYLRKSQGSVKSILFSWSEDLSSPYFKTITYISIFQSSRKLDREKKIDYIGKILHDLVMKDVLSYAHRSSILMPQRITNLALPKVFAWTVFWALFMIYTSPVFIYTYLCV